MAGGTNPPPALTSHSEHCPQSQKYYFNPVYPVTGLSAASGILQEPLTLAEQPVPFPSTPLLFCCHSLS